MVQAFGREDDVRSRFGLKARAVQDGVLRQARIEGTFLPGLLFLPAMSIGIVLLFGGHAVIKGNLDPRGVLPLLLVAAPARVAARGARLDHQPRPARDGVGVAQLRVARADRRDSRAGDSGALPDGPLDVRFEGVHFSYGSGSEVLRGVDLNVDSGEIVAVCGPTGGGKTSLLNLLPRFYDPTGGRVLLGGVDARDVPIAELRSAVAIVTQRPILFSITLRDNLTAARPDAPWAEVLDACEAAGVTEFADDLPDGYDTLIGERGVNLSGGQRQRVALARALIAGARVIVLDDPLSAVDTETERLLVDNLRPAVAGRTVLVATQRLSTVEVATGPPCSTAASSSRTDRPPSCSSAAASLPPVRRRAPCRVAAARDCRGSASTWAASTCGVAYLSVSRVLGAAGPVGGSCSCRTRSTTA